MHKTLCEIDSISLRLICEFYPAISLACPTVAAPCRTEPPCVSMRTDGKNSLLVAFPSDSASESLSSCPHAHAWRFNGTANAKNSLLAPEPIPLTPLGSLRNLDLL